MAPDVSEDKPATPVSDSRLSSKLRLTEWLCIYLLSFGGSLFLSLAMMLPFYKSSVSMAHASPEGYLIRISVVIATLVLLWCLMARRGQSLQTLGFARPTTRDILNGICLGIAAFVASQGVHYLFLYGSALFSGGHPTIPTQTPNTGWLSGQGTAQTTALMAGLMATLRIVNIVLNPVHEEVVARAFTQTEMEGAARWSPVAASLFSAILQGAYHLYQGIPAAMGVTAIFFCLAFYFQSQRRIMPVILAHAVLDWYALFRQW